MKILYCSLIFLSFLHLSIADVENWNKAPWGTKTLKSLLEPYGNSRSGLGPTIDSYKVSRVYVFDGKNYHCDIVLRQVNVGGSEKGRHMDAYFLWNEKGELSAIQLEETIWHDAMEVFEYLKRYLTTLYSSPASETRLLDKKVQGLRENYAFWKTKNSKVTLLYISMPDQGFYRISITFEPIQ